MNEVKQIGNYEINSIWDNPQTGRVYSPDGLSPTLNTCGGGGHEVKIIEMGSLNSSQDGVILSPEGVSKTITSGHNNQPKILEPIIVRSTGRNPDNPSDRTAGNHVEQRLEPNAHGMCNTLTSVQKDNLVLEPCGIYTGVSDEFQRGPLPGMSRCIKASNHDAGVIMPNYRIRKLTPLECWRLMDFSDEDFYKAEAVNSNTQLYKEAGNSIVKAVLMSIFGQMIPGKEYAYKNFDSRQQN